jgi:hypothetical protein
VHIDFLGASVAVSPLKTRVLPIDLDASASTMGGSGAIGGFVGIETSLVIYLRDTYGNRLTVGGHESIKVSVYNPDGSVLVTQIAQDQGDGTLVSKYILNTVGDGFKLAVRTTFDEVHVVGSPREKLIGMLDNAATVPTTSFSQGAGISRVLAAGERGDLTVFAANYVALPRLVGGDMFVATLTRPLEKGGEESQAIALVDNADGTYTGAYTKTEAGFYQLTITIDGEHLLGSPFAVQIVAAPSSHSHSSRSPSRRTNWVPLQVWCVHLTFKPLINIHESLVPKDHTNLSWVFIWVFKSAVTVFPLAPRRHQGALTYAHHLLSSSILLHPPPSDNPVSTHKLSI